MCDQCRHRPPLHRALSECSPRPYVRRARGWFWRRCVLIFRRGRAWRSQPECGVHSLGGSGSHSSPVFNALMAAAVPYWGSFTVLASGRKVFQVVTALLAPGRNCIMGFITHLAFAQIRWCSVYLWLRVASVFWCSMAFWLYSTARHVRIASVSSKSYWLVGGRACGRIRFVGSSGFMAPGRTCFVGFIYTVAPGRISAMGVNLGMAFAH